MSGPHWVTKWVDRRELETELNAFHQQDYVIRWLFPDHDPLQPGYELIAERRHEEEQ